jgi:chromate transporter
MAENVRLVEAGRTAPSRPAAPAGRSGRTVRGLARYFGKLGSSGFGGPIALVGYMHRDLVEDRGWYTEDEYRQALAVGQMFPGPLAAQTGMWLGYLEAGWRGAVAVIVPFVLPPFFMVTAVAVIYAKYQGLSVVHDIFSGVGPAVLAIIAIAAVKLARKTNQSDPVAWTIAVILCTATALAGAEIIWLVLVAGLFGAIWWGGGLPRFGSQAASFSPAALLANVNGFALTGGGASLASLGLFFLAAGAFTFGSGLAIVPYLHSGLVENHHWITNREFVDAVSMGLISPGPVVIMATFAGYLVDGLVGAIVATVAVFLPVLFYVLVPGRFVRRYEDHPRLKGFVQGATAAATGAIAGAAIVIAGQVISGALSVIIALVALVILLQRVRSVKEPVVVFAAGVAGLALYS